MRGERRPESFSVGRWRAITLLTPLKRGVFAPLYLARLKLAMGIGNRTDLFLSPLLDMRVIAFARYSLFSDRTGRRWLLFETTWSGSPQTYIPDLLDAMQVQANTIWGNVVGWPGPVPATPLLEWVDRNDWGAGHLWTDYREGASAQVAVASLLLSKKFERFVRETAGSSPSRLAERWQQFTTANQKLL